MDFSAVFVLSLTQPVDLAASANNGDVGNNTPAGSDNAQNGAAASINRYYRAPAHATSLDDAITPYQNPAPLLDFSDDKAIAPYDKNQKQLSLVYSDRQLVAPSSARAGQLVATSNTLSQQLVAASTANDGQLVPASAIGGGQLQVRLAQPIAAIEDRQAGLGIAGQPPSLEYGHMQSPEHGQLQSCAYGQISATRDGRLRSVEDLHSSLNRLGRSSLTFGPLEDDDDNVMQTEADRIESQIGRNGVC